MIVSRRTFFFLLVTGFLVMPLTAFGQVGVWPSDLYKPPGDPSCFTVMVDGGGYMPVYLEIYTPWGGPEYWYLELDGNGQAYGCVDEGWADGQYVITGVYYYGWWYSSAWASFTVYPAPQSPPVIYGAGAGCDNWDCVWATGIRFQPDSRVLAYSADWAYSQTYYGPAWQAWPPLNVDGDGQSLSFHVEDPNLRSAFGWSGLYIIVLNNDGTNSEWRRVQSPAPTISSGGPTCSDLYCIQLSGVFPLDAYVDFRVPGDPEILQDAYTDLVVTASQITLRLKPSVRYAYDTSGLNAWAVNPSVGNGSSPYYLGPVDRSVTGYIDDVFPIGQQYYIRGWACAKTQPASIDVHVYAGGPAGGGGTLVFSGTANQASEPEVAAACNATGSNYRYYLPIPHTVTQNYGGQPFYVYGISPLGYSSLLLNNSGSFLVPSVDRSVTGWISALSTQGQNYFLTGWACAKTYAGSIDVHVYVGGPSGVGGTLVLTGTANQPSGPDVAAACNSTGSNYWFSIQIPQWVMDQYAGQPIYVHGISPFGLTNLLLNASGNFNVPAIDRSITGWINGTSQQGSSFYLHGWACAKTYPGSVEVQAYVGAPAGSGGVLAFSGAANGASDPALQTACNSTGSNYGFWLQIPASVIQQYGGQPIYVLGISPFGLPNLAIGNSGNFLVPGAPSGTLYWKKDYIKDAKGATIAAATPQPLDTTPPTAPTAEQCSNATSTALTVSWSQASDSGSGVAGYTVYRGALPVGSVVSTATTFVDNVLQPQTGYSYRVVALDYAMNPSDFSNTVHCQTQ